MASGAESTNGSLSRSDVETFLFDEAAILDEWMLDDWLEFFDERSVYLVPTTDNPGGHPEADQFVIADDYDGIRARVRRLKSRKAHAENPRSRTRRLITNVRLERLDADGAAHVTASFLVYRIKYGLTTQFVGQYRHVLVQADGKLRFRRRVAVIDQEALENDGRVSIIL
jgi:p-cumate 2,3-dioxygenase subunit beta